MGFQTGKEVFWQSGFLATVLTLFLFPYYKIFCSLLREHLGSHNSDQMIFVVITSITHTVCYVSITGFFATCDHFRLLQQYKLPRKPYMAPKTGLVAKALMEAAVGQLIINPLAVYFVYPYFKHFGMMGIDEELPSAGAMFKTFCIAHLFNGIGFYWAHRLFHSKSLYATFHKQHHEFNGTIGIAAEYANPVEQIFANTLPTIGGVLFFGTHPLCVCVWLVRYF
jgi:methylsterol monooxygenase